MARKNIPEAESKLIILQVLSFLGPVNSTQLAQYSAEEDLLDYFSLQINLSELLQEGQVAERSHPSGTLLIITETGTQTLENWENRIPPSTMKHLHETSKVWKQRFLMEQQAPTAFYPTKTGETCLRLQLLHQDRSIMDLLLTSPHAAPPTFLSERWQHYAPDVYQLIFQLLSTNQLPWPAESKLPDCVALQHIASGDCQLILGDPEGTISLLLLVPTERLARIYITNWHIAKDIIYQRLLELFEESWPTNDSN